MKMGPVSHSCESTQRERLTRFFIQQLEHSSLIISWSVVTENPLPCQPPVPEDGGWHGQLLQIGISPERGPKSLQEMQPLLYSVPSTRGNRIRCLSPLYEFLRVAIAIDHRLRPYTKNVSSHSSGGQMSQIKVSAKPRFLRRLWGRVLLASSSLWGLRALAEDGSIPPVSATLFPWPSSPCLRVTSSYPFSSKDPSHGIQGPSLIPG